MIIKGATVLTDQWTFNRQDIWVEGSRIAGFSPVVGDDEMVIDATGLTILPGLVDCHIHGCSGYDFCDLDEQAIPEMSRYLGHRGVTSFLGATMAFDESRLDAIFQKAVKAIDSKTADGAQLRGIYMEGPFFARQKKGAQSEKYIIDPDLALLQRLVKAAGAALRILAIAPELPGAMDLIRLASRSITVSLAHTMANYEIASEAFANGASQVTHLFNAMPPFTHRDPGVIGAASDSGASVEIICDGIHLHPSVIRSVFKWFGSDRIILVSDAMRACGLPDGQYELGGQPVRALQGRATLADGTIAGSAADLFTCLQNTVRFGIPIADAVRAATINPARQARIDSEVGSIKVGKQADLILVDQNLELVHVIQGGRML